MGPDLYRVLWDDGGYTDCKSTTLKYEGEGTPLMERMGGRSRVLGSLDEPVPPFNETALQPSLASNNIMNVITIQTPTLQQATTTPQPPTLQTQPQPESMVGASSAEAAPVTAPSPSIADTITEGDDSDAPVPPPPPPNTMTVNKSTNKELRTLGNFTSHDSAESFHTAPAVSEQHPPEPNSTVLETNPEDVFIPNEGVVDIEDELEYENYFLYEDSAEREQQQGEFWEYQRVVAKQKIDQ